MTTRVIDFPDGYTNDTAPTVEGSDWGTITGNLADQADLQAALDALQTEDADLSALGNLATNGLIARTGAGTAATRTVTGTTDQITVTNGDGVAGDPTLAISDNPVLSGTDSATLPKGTTAERGALVDGKIRYNTDLNTFEGVASGAWGAIAGGGSGANDTLSNLGTTAVNADLNPATDNTIKLGSGVGNRYAEANIQYGITNYVDFINEAGTEYTGSISGPTPSNPYADILLESYNAVGGPENTIGLLLRSVKPLQVDTINYATTSDITLKTGNASAGNSGDIAIQTGTATGTRGSIVLDGESVDFTTSRGVNLSDPIGLQDAATKGYVKSNSGVNFIADSDGSSIGSWAAYADAAGTSPVDGTGGSPTSTIAVSTNSDLVGTSNFLWTKPASNTQGEGFSVPFSIGSAFQSKPCTISAFYKVDSGTYADGDLTVWIYDVTNSQLIQPSAYSILNNTGVGEIKCEFQTNYNSTSYRLIFHTSSTSAVAYALRFDSIVVSPNTYNRGASISDFSSALVFPLSPGYGTTTYKKETSRRVGDSLEVIGTFVSGTLSASLAYIDLPSGYTIDGDKLTTNANATMVGFCESTTNTLGIVPKAAIFYDGSTNNRLFIGYRSNSGIYVKENCSVLSYDNAVFTYKISVPILGWSTSQVLSSDTDTRITAARYTNATGTLAASVNIIKFTAKDFDTHGLYDTATGLWTANRSGKVRISGTIYVTGTTSISTIVGLYLYKNGVEIMDYVNSVNTTCSTTMTDLVEVVAGDTLALYSYTNVTTPSYSSPSLTSNVTFEYLSGTAQIAASEKIYLQYVGNGSNVLTADVTNATWSTKVVDSHGAWSGTVFTAPRPGWYDVDGVLLFNASVSSNPYIWVNGVKKTLIGQPQSINAHVMSGGAYLNAGDQLSIRIDGGGTLDNNATAHVINITSQG